MRTTEYIKREYAVDAVVDVYYNTSDIDLSCEKFEAAILKIPSSDVAPVKHGKWGSNGIPDSMLSACSVCGFGCGAYSFQYCPICGSKMDGECDA